MAGATASKDHPSGLIFKLGGLGDDKALSMSETLRFLYHRLLSDGQSMDTLVTRGIPVLHGYLNPHQRVATTDNTAHRLSARGLHVDVKPIANHHSQEQLLALELVGHAMLGNDATPSAQKYQRWRSELNTQRKDEMGIGDMTQFQALINTDHWLGPVVTDALQCPRIVYGPIGLYWVLLVLLAMYEGPHVHVIPVPIFCDETTQSVCDGVPLGCDVSYCRKSADDWVHVAPLIRFLLGYMCDSMGGVHGRLTHRESSPLVIVFYPRDIAHTDMVLYCVIAATRGCIPLNGNAFTSSGC